MHAVTIRLRLVMLFLVTDNLNRRKLIYTPFLYEQGVCICPGVLNFLVYILVCISVGAEMEI